MNDERSHDVGVETVSAGTTIIDLSDDEMDSVASSVDGHLNSGSMMARSDGPRLDEAQSTNDKVNDSSDVRVKKKLKSSNTSESTTVSVVLDEKTGQLVVSQEKDGDDERNTNGVSSVSKDINEFVRYDQTCRDDVQSSDKKVNESPTDMCNIAYLKLDEKTGQFFMSQTVPVTKDKKDNEIVITDKVDSASTACKGHMILHVPVEKQNELLRFQVNPECVMLRPTVPQAMNLSGKHDTVSDVVPATVTRKLTVWAQSLVDIGLDLVKSTILQDFINLPNKKNTGKVRDVAKVQLESAKKSQEELRYLTEHLDVGMNRKCKLCRFCTESSNVLHWHQQHAHTNPRGIVSCSYCEVKTQNFDAFHIHMQTGHMKQAFFERETKKYECSLCNYKTNSRKRYCKHWKFCERTFQLITNLCPTASHVTYCLHDGLFIKPSEHNFPPSKLAQAKSVAKQVPIYNPAHVSNAMAYKIVNHPFVPMASLQEQLPIKQTVQPITSFLNTGGQQQFPIKQTIQPITSFLNTGGQQQPSIKQAVQPITSFLNTGGQQQPSIKQAVQPITSFLNTGGQQQPSIKQMVQPITSFLNTGGQQQLPIKQTIQPGSPFLNTGGQQHLPIKQTVQPTSSFLNTTGQLQLPSRPTVQPVSPFLNTGGQQQHPTWIRPIVQSVSPFLNTGGQQRLPLRPPVQPVSPFLNTGGQQRLPLRPTVQPITLFVNRGGQQQVPIRLTVQPVSSFLNPAAQQNIGRQRIVGQEDSFDTMFTGSASQQPGILPAMLNQLTANPSMIPQFQSDPDIAQYNEQHQKQLTHLRQLQVQNAQAMQILKQQDQLLQHLQKSNLQQQTLVKTTTKTHATVSSDNVNSTLNVITCEICQGFVKNTVALRLHLFYAHQVSISDKAFNASTPFFWCCLCQGQFWSRQGLTVHKAICKASTVAPVHLPIPFIVNTQQNKAVTKRICFICDSPVISFLAHMKSVHDLTWADFLLPYNKMKCVACGLIFRSCDLDSHMSCTHGLILVNPDKQSPLMKKCNPARLTKIHSRYMQCEICKYFVKANSYQRHIEIKHLKMYRVSLKRLSEQQIEQYTRVKYRKLDSASHVYAEVGSSSCSPQRLNAECKPLKQLPANTNENKDINHVETKHLRKCCVAVNRLSEQKISQYARGKHCKLNSALQVSAEETGTTSLQQNKFSMPNTRSSNADIDRKGPIVILDDIMYSPVNKSPRRISRRLKKQ